MSLQSLALVELDAYWQNRIASKHSASRPISQTTEVSYRTSTFMWNGRHGSLRKTAETAAADLQRACAATTTGQKARTGLQVRLAHYLYRSDATTRFKPSL
jgi:hypothetical protein